VLDEAAGRGDAGESGDVQYGGGVDGGGRVAQTELAGDEGVAGEPGGGRGRRRGVDGGEYGVGGLGDVEQGEGADAAGDRRRVPAESRIKLERS
jgi:hypothetical protein